MVKIPVSNTEGQPTVIEVCWQPVPHQIFKITGAIVVYGHVSGFTFGMDVAATPTAFHHVGIRIQPTGLEAKFQYVTASP